MMFARRLLNGRCSLTTWCVHCIIARRETHRIDRLAQVDDADDNSQTQDIDDVVRAGIDGFSLNIGNPNGDNSNGNYDVAHHYLNNMFGYVEATFQGTFTFHISMDMSAATSNDPGDDVLEAFQHYFDEFASSPVYQHGPDGRPTVTTFDSGQLSIDAWQAWRSSNDVFFIPNLADEDTDS